MYRVRILWDEEADVWIAESDDIPGLVLEDASLTLLVRRVLAAAPELLEWNRWHMLDPVQAGPHKGGCK